MAEITPKSDIVINPELMEGLKALEPTIQSLEKEIALAKLAGIDVSEIELKLEESKKLRSGILDVYGG